MVKAPSSHGLDRKYRSWRKGKSAKAKKQGSLKHQLRGQERLLGKLLRKKQDSKDDNDNADDDKARIEELRKQVQSLKDEIAEKEGKEHERKNAKSSHGTRFLERQRATRLERTARKEADETELTRIAMDMIYVAHFPHQKTYRPLYRNGKRWLQHSVSRAETRHKIIQDLQENRLERAKWISKDMYARVPSEWTVAREVEMFDYPKGEKSKEKKVSAQDDRFALNTQHDAFLEIANKLESKLEKEEVQEKPKTDAAEDSSSSESGSDSNENEKKPVTKGVAKRQLEEKSGDASSSSSDSDSSDDNDDEPDKEIPAKRQRTEDAGDDSNSDSSDSDSDSEDEAKALDSKKAKPEQTNKVANVNVKKEDTSDSSSSSDSSSDSDSDDDVDNEKGVQTEKSNDNKQQQGSSKQDDSESDDDFFVAAQESKEDDVGVFDRVKNQDEHVLAAENPARGDKSQGWATQRQRPGQFKKKRERR